MTLGLDLRRISLLPFFAQTGGDPPSSGMKRKIHWVGKKEPIAQNQDSGPKRGGEFPKKMRRYRKLSNITLGEVSDAYNYYANQLVQISMPAWLGVNQFCMIPLKENREPHPPTIFGRIKVCYPSDGYIQNIQELELMLPAKNHAPEVVHVRGKDVLNSLDKPVQSYCVRVRFLFLPEDLAEFSGSDNLFFGKGFQPEYQTGYIDLLEITAHNHTTLPWMYVIGSRWFASIPDSFQVEVREKLIKLIQWNKLIFNYHPEQKLSREIRSLNRELGFKPGYTDIFLIEPETPEQTIQIVSKTFDKLFQQPIT